jgi:hypothetical protein
VTVCACNKFTLTITITMTVLTMMCIFLLLPLYFCGTNVYNHIILNMCVYMCMCILYIQYYVFYIVWNFWKHFLLLYTLNLGTLWRWFQQVAS